MKKNHIYDFIGSYYYTYMDAMEQQARWYVEVCGKVMKQKSPPGNESHVSSPYSHYTDWQTCQQVITNIFVAYDKYGERF